MKKHSVWVWTLSAIALGCASSETPPPPAAAAGTTQGGEMPPAAAVAPTGPSSADLVKRYQECWGYINNKQWDPFTQCYAENATSEWLDSGMPMAMSRTDLIEKQTKPFMAAFPDFHGDLQLTLVNGHSVASIAVIHGTHEGTLLSPMGAIPATHKKIGILVAHMADFNDQGQVVKETFVQDMGTMMAQLGLSPAPARAVIDANWPETPTISAAGGDIEQANLARAATMYAAFNAHDKAMFDSSSDGVTDHNPSFPVDVKGKPAMIDFIGALWGGFPDLRADVSSSWAAGDYVVTRLAFGGENKGPLPMMGITTPTGKKMLLNTIEVTKWQNGKLTDIWPMFNGAAMAGQLGLVPPPPSAAAPAPAAATKKTSAAKASKKK